MKKWHYFLIFSLVVCFAGFFTIYARPHKTLLIIGCARSGTAGIAKALQKGGLKIGHEKMKRDGISSWDLAANPKVGRSKVRPEKFHFAHVFHQVRHPLKCISSVYTTEDQNSWDFIMAHIPEIHEQDPHLVKCAKYWYYWNLLAEENAEWTYRIEDIDYSWDEFEKRLGKKIQHIALENIPEETDTKNLHTHDFTWEDLQKGLDATLYDNIRMLARKYGYVE